MRSWRHRKEAGTPPPRHRIEVVELELRLDDVQREAEGGTAAVTSMPAVGSTPPVWPGSGGGKARRAHRSVTTRSARAEVGRLAATAAGPVVLVSADRGLGDRCSAVGAEVVGPSWLLDRLSP